MFAVAAHFSAKDAERAFKMFVSWSVRFLIAGGRGGFLNKHYATLAAEISNGKLKTADDLVNKAEKQMLPADAEFEARFAIAFVSKAYLARYYLRALEKHEKGNKSRSGCHPTTQRA